MKKNYPASTPPITDRPTAKVIKVEGEICHIICPYCGEEHSHIIYEKTGLEARAAACDLWFPINPEQRLHGYEFSPYRKIITA